MPTVYPSAIDTYTTLVDNVSTVLAETPNFLASAIISLESYVGVTNSPVVTSHTYLLSHLPGQAQNWNMGPYTLTAAQFLSTVNTGTAPMTIASTTMVSNLNVQYHAGLSAPSSNIVGISDTQTLSNKTLSTCNVSSLTTPLSVANGGTGATTQAAASKNIFPPVTGQAGNYVTTDGTNIYWVSIGPASQIQTTTSDPSSPSNGTIWLRTDF